MERLLRYWNQNKRKILITIAFIALVIIIIQIANEMVKQQNNNRKNVSQQNTQTAQDVTKPSEAIISNTKLDEKEVEDNSQLIETFVKYCNEKKIEEAYSLLSDDCKQAIYSNSNVFIDNYINEIFNTQKTYKLELWTKYNDCYTYRITYLEGNPLQTGGYTNDNNFVDYITVVTQEQGLKLNISKLVYKEKLNKTQNDSNIEVTVNSKLVYIDYEIYNITVKNNTDRTILLNDGKTASKFCLLDEKDNAYNSIINELPMNSLILDAKYQRTFNLKFNKIYNASSKITYMKITDIYLDKDQYDSNVNIEELETTTIKIKL